MRRTFPFPAWLVCSVLGVACFFIAGCRSSQEANVALTCVSMNLAFPDAMAVVERIDGTERLSLVQISAGRRRIVEKAWMFMGVAWSGDGNSLWACPVPEPQSASWQLIRYDRKGEPLLKIRAHGRPEVVRPSASGSVLLIQATDFADASALDEPVLVRLDVPSGSETVVARRAWLSWVGHPWLNEHEVIYVQEDKALASVYHLVRLDVSSGRAAKRFSGPIGYVALSPDARRFAAVLRRQRAGELVVGTVSGEAVARVVAAGISAAVWVTPSVLVVCTDAGDLKSLNPDSGKSTHLLHLGRKTQQVDYVPGLEVVWAWPDRVEAADLTTRQRRVLYSVEP